MPRILCAVLVYEDPRMLVRDNGAHRVGIHRVGSHRSRLLLELQNSSRTRLLSDHVYILRDYGAFHRLIKYSI